MRNHGQAQGRRFGHGAVKDCLPEARERGQVARYLESQMKHLPVLLPLLLPSLPASTAFGVL
ncbi:unnamed protein product [Chondrus crispus]|uniref:Uncharacterized protein n=1 Tax=Chondrus crispus TaxID=2769 RepID=R7QE45_CHOCR|nr:unnamed protein product [Chondrus crispus]CDF36003.1 unnamed protein product [Chondrus crispus]|eukprot:XP_005715822.1 unnamed protein product [Chondrus crispus]